MVQEQRHIDQEAWSMGVVCFLFKVLRECIAAEVAPATGSRTSLQIKP